MLDIPEGERVYIDSSIFIIHHSKNLPAKKECTDFLRSVEEKKYEAFISTLVVDEVTYILLKQKASEILETDKHYQILDKLKADEDLFSQCWETAQEHINYVMGLEAKDSLKVIKQMPELESLSSTIGKYKLLPRNSTHLSIMLSMNISNITTTDEDFDEINEIKAWKP